MAHIHMGAPLTGSLLSVFSIFLLLSLSAAWAACTPSNLAGYSCVVSVNSEATPPPNPNVLVHWTSNSTHYSIAAVYPTSGWVALGWSNGGSGDVSFMAGEAVVANTAQYGHIQTFNLSGTEGLDGLSASAANFEVYAASVSTVSGTTTLSFTRPFGNDGSVPVYYEGLTLLIWAHSATNSMTLADHTEGNRGHFWINFQTGNTFTAYDLPASAVSAPPPSLKAGGCTPSNLVGYTCSYVAQAGAYDSQEPETVIHWSASSSQYSIAVDAGTTSWVAFGWSLGDNDAISYMAGEAVIVNAGNNVGGIGAYNLSGTEDETGLSLTSAFKLGNVKVTTYGGRTLMEFTRTYTDGLVKVGYTGYTLVIWAHNQNDSSIFGYHGESNRGHLWINFAEGIAVDSDPNAPAPTASTPSPATSPAASTSGTCPPSTMNGFSCMVSAKGNGDQSVLLHYNPPTGGVIELALDVATSGWVGLGWSTDGKMVGSDAVIASGDSLSVGAYHLSSQSTSGVKEVTSFTPTATSAVTTGGRTVLRFSRKVGDGGAVPVSTGTNTLIYAFGGSTALGDHGANHKGRFQVDFTSGAVTASQNSTPKKSMYDAHAWLMWLAFGVFMPAGILVARWHRKCLTPMAFYTHVGLQSTGWVLAAVGALIALIQFQALDGVHGKLGLAAMSAVFVQPGLGLIRPDKGKPLRPYWFAIHWTMGIVAMVLGWITIFFGLNAYSSLWSLSVKTLTLLWGIQVGVMGYTYLILGEKEKILPVSSEKSLSWQALKESRGRTPSDLPLEDPSTMSTSVPE